MFFSAFSGVWEDPHTGVYYYPTPLHTPLFVQSYVRHLSGSRVPVLFRNPTGKTTNMGYARYGQFKKTGYGSKSTTMARQQSQRSGARQAQYAAFRRQGVIGARPKPGSYLSGENKFLDCALSSVNIANTWSTLNPAGTGCTDSLSVPAQGDGESNRDGRVYYMNSIHIKGRILLAASEGNADPQGDSFCRIILFWISRPMSWKVK